MTGRNEHSLSALQWILIFAGLILLLLTVRFFFDLSDGNRERALILLDGKTVRTLDLSEDQTFVLDTGYGTNTIQVTDGCVSVTDADCPDRVCTAHGPLTDNSMPIICLPHHLVIRFEPGHSDVDIIAE